MPSGHTNNSPESGRGLGHVTSTILAVRSDILATAWLLVILETRILKLENNSILDTRFNGTLVERHAVFFAANASKIVYSNLPTLLSTLKTNEKYLTKNECGRCRVPTHVGNSRVNPAKAHNYSTA